MNEEQRKLQARCSTIGMVVRAAFWLLILLLAARVGIAVWCSMLPAGHFMAVRQQTETILCAEKGLTVSFPAQTAAPAALLAHKKEAFLIGAWSGCLASAFLCAVLWQLRGLFKGIDEEGAPFQARHVARVHRAGVLMMLRGVVPHLAEGIVLMIFGMWGGTVFGSEALRSGGLWIFTGSVLLCLAQIFRYGCALQTESDETL